MTLSYPIDLSFKILALASQIYVRDGAGRTLGYVKQKLLKLKEDVRVFADESQARELFQIKADRVIDWSAHYSFTDSQSGRPLGGVKRQGMKSLWRAHYDIDDGAQVVMTLREENAMVKVADALLGEVPVVGMFAGYFLNPSYVVGRVDGTPVARLKKQKAFLEGKFQLSALAEMTAEEETRVLLACLMMALLERARG